VYLVSTYSAPKVSHDLVESVSRVAYLARTWLRRVDVRAVEACSDEKMKWDAAK
jgi:hypothetical protein